MLSNIYTDLHGVPECLVPWQTCFVDVPAQRMTHWHKPFQKKTSFTMIPSPSWNPTSFCLCQTTCAYLSRTANLEPALETHNCDGGGKMMENHGKMMENDGKMMENLGISMSSGCHFCLRTWKTTAFDPTRIRGCKATPQTHILQHQVTLDRFKATAPKMPRDRKWWDFVWDFCYAISMEIIWAGVLWYYGDRDEILIKSHTNSDIPSGKLT